MCLFWWQPNKTMGGTFPGMQWNKIKASLLWPHCKYTRKRSTVMYNMDWYSYAQQQNELVYLGKALLEYFTFICTATYVDLPCTAKHYLWSRVLTEGQLEHYDEYNWVISPCISTKQRICHLLLTRALHVALCTYTLRWTNPSSGNTLHAEVTF